MAKEFYEKGGAIACIHAHTGISLKIEDILQYEANKIGEILHFYQYHTKLVNGDKVADRRMTQEILNIAAVIFERKGLPIKTLEDYLKDEPGIRLS